MIRPGGGSSYSGGSSGGGGGGGGDGGGALVEILVWLVLEHPAIGIPVLLIVIVYYVVKHAFFSPKGADWSAGNVSVAPPPMQVEPPAWRAPRRTLSVIAGVDPRFSRVVFEDFLYSLYAEVQVARGQRQLDRVSAYLAPPVARTLLASARGPIDTVIVGSLAVVDASADPRNGCRVVVDIESNYTEAGRGVYVAERWTLVRGSGAASREPQRARILGCPSCGAPQAALFGGRCKHCGKTVNDGTFDWTVSEVLLQRREERPPILTADVAEVGTDLPTVFAPDLAGALGALRAKDPAFAVDALKARIALVFQEFQRAWSARELAPMRPFLSDALFTTQQYWTRAYVAQRLRNVTEGTRITDLQIVRATTDAFYDAITVRLFATGLDYVVTDEGKLVSGSKSRPRAYSEYWTLIRGTNRKGPSRTDLACPNCGAPLQVNMSGDCAYCRAKVTTGDFDWVLSRIEQDESYVGGG